MGNLLGCLTSVWNNFSYRLEDNYFSTLKANEWILQHPDTRRFGKLIRYPWLHALWVTIKYSTINGKSVFDHDE